MAGVKTTHADYDKYSAKWKRCRDAVEGQDAIHEGGVAYLPRLKGEDDADYTARTKRSDFFNGTWRTINGLGGMIFRKPPVVDVPNGIAPYLDDINLAGKDLDGIASEVIEDLLAVGRIGLLVDHPTAPENVSTITVATAARMGLRPTIQLYRAESIINWKHTRVSNAWALSMVVLKECEAIPDGEFVQKDEDRYRVLDLDEGGRYRQRLFMVVDGKDIQIGGDIYPLMNGQPLDYIPFAIVGVEGKGADIDAPPLVDLVNSNLALYQINSDYRHGLHFTGLPTAVVSGYVPEKAGEKLYIGSASAWVFPDPAARAAYLEFTGQGLGALKEAIADKKQEMAVLGARMIADESMSVEKTLGATQIKRAGENGVLGAIALSASKAITWALEIFAEWGGHAGEVSYELNRDFTPTEMSPQQLTALMAAWQQGGLSEADLFVLLKRGDLIAHDKTLEEHQEQVASAISMPRPEAA